jgi:hypothetical protein
VRSLWQRRSPKAHDFYRHFVEYCLKPDLGRYRPPDLTRPEVRRLAPRAMKADFGAATAAALCDMHFLNTTGLHKL